MRKLRYLWLASVVVAMTASCTLNRLEDPSASGREGTQVTLTAYAPDSNAGSKAMLLDGEPEVYWAPNEEIMVFKKDWGTTIFQSTNTEPAAVVDFSGSIYGSAGVVGPEDQIWAVYPCSWNNTYFDYQDGNYLELVLPFTQTPVAGTFDPKALLMVARSADTDLAFYHLDGGLKFKLTQDWIQQVEFRSNDGTPLAGMVQVVMDGEGHPVVSEYEETTDAVLLTAPRGQFFQKDTWYYLCCLPAVLEQGYTLTFRSEHQTGMTLAGPAEVKRATWGVLDAADKGVVPAAAENDLYGDTIYYTSTDGNIVEPNSTWGFGATLISNVYENGQGIMTFDGPVTGLSNSVFNGRTTLKSIKLPSTVWEIGGWAFSGCSSLQSITLSERLSSIGDYAFQSTVITELDVPGGLRSVSQHAFSNCNITTLHGPLATADERGLVIDGTLVAFVKNGLTSGADYEIEAGITGLADRVFDSVWQFRDVTLPESLEAIGEEAFRYCSNMRAFYGKFASEDGHLLVQDGRILAAALQGCSEYKVPGTYRSIGPYAFASIYSVHVLTISEGIEQIEDGAFENCGNLREVTLPESVIVLGKGAFRYTGNLQQFHGKFASEDGRFLIDGNGTLLAAALGGSTDYVVPEGVKEIAESVFESSNLTSIVLPQSLQKIGAHAFAYNQNTAFTSFTLPAGVTELDYEILAYCTSLKDITLLPGSVPTYNTDWSYPLGDGLGGATIYVPEDLLETYRTTRGWSNQRNYQVIPEYPTGTNEQMHDNDWD